MISYSFLGMIVVFVVSMFWSRLNAVSDFALSCRNRADDAVRTVESYERSTDQIQEFYNDEYLIRCRLAADIITKAPAYRTRAGMKEIANLLGVNYVYLFDQSGTVAVTNSPFDHFTLSENESDQSYAFWPLLDGNDFVVQEPLPDDVSGKWMQYVGVSLRNEEDLADGFVQIGVHPKEYEQIVENMNLSTKLNAINIANRGFAFAVDEETKTITYAPRKKWVGKAAEKIGIKDEKIADDFVGYLKIKDTLYFAAAEEIGSNDQLVFVVIPWDDLRSGQWGFVVLTSLLALFTMLGMSWIALRRLNEAEGEAVTTEDCADTDESAADRLSEKTPSEDRPDTDGITEERTNADPPQTAENTPSKPKRFRWLDAWGITINQQLEARWKTSHQPWKLSSAGEKTFRLFQIGIFIFSLFIAWVRLFGESVLPKDSIIVYIIQEQWEKGPNIFAAAACLMILCLIYAAVKIADRILYSLARISDTRTETVCHLLRSLIAYGSVIATLYYCLAQFGVNTRTLLASAGILSLVIGLGAQGLVTDIVAGLFIIFENQFAVGDYVQVGDWLGFVTEIGIRTTKISFQGEVKCFNNSDIRGVRNLSASDTSIANCEIGFSYEDSLTKLQEIFDQELPLLQEKIDGATGQATCFGIVRLEDSAIVMKFQLPCESRKKARVQAAFYRELLLLLERNQIELPYPHMTIG
ncbi:MAG: mechanosensitive ion channel [Lachnospiraceae bacterium]|nr:mechanosensitive ion channel [Lachnospiraceae bacterium]